MSVKCDFWTSFFFVAFVWRGLRSRLLFNMQLMRIGFDAAAAVSYNLCIHGARTSYHYGIVRTWIMVYNYITYYILCGHAVVTNIRAIIVNKKRWRKFNSARTQRGRVDTMFAWLGCCVFFSFLFIFFFLLFFSLIGGQFLNHYPRATP